MTTWLLLAFVFAVWCCWVVACAAEKAVKEARRGVPVGQRGGVSAVPGIPVFPLVFWGFAVVLDLFVSPWGIVIIGGFHLVFLVLLLVSIAKNWWCLRILDKNT
jgi:hypothetical protein